MELINIDTSHVGYKIPIYPNEEQKKIFEDYFNTCRFVYNLGIEIQEEYYRKAKDNDNYKYKTLSYIGIRNKISELKKTDEYAWLNKYNNDTITSIVKDVINAYKKFFKGQNRHPRFKKKKNYHKQFPIRGDRLSIEKDRVRISSIGYVSCYNTHNEIIGNSNKNIVLQHYIHYANPRVIYDGCNYYLTLSIPRDDSNTYITNSEKVYSTNEEWINKPSSNVVGIDVGCKQTNWIVDSNNTRINRPDTSKEENKIKKLQKQLKRQRKQNTKRMLKRTNSTNIEYKYSKRELKTLKKLNKYHKRITNKKKNAIYEYTSKLISSKPKAVVIEDIKVEDMYITNKDVPRKYRDRHNKIVKDSILYTVHNIITYKCINNGINVYKADREYPSSQLCSLCGYRQDIGKKKIYRCPCCGNIIDRDLNASINLENLITKQNEAITMFIRI